MNISSILNSVNVLMKNILLTYLVILCPVFAYSLSPIDNSIYAYVNLPARIDNEYRMIDIALYLESTILNVPLDQYMSRGGVPGKRLGDIFDAIESRSLSKLREITHPAVSDITLNQYLNMADHFSVINLNVLSKHKAGNRLYFVVELFPLEGNSSICRVFDLVEDGDTYLWDGGSPGIIATLIAKAANVSKDTSVPFIQTEKRTFDKHILLELGPGTPVFLAFNYDWLNALNLLDLPADVELSPVINFSHHALMSLISGDYDGYAGSYTKASENKIKNWLAKTPVERREDFINSFLSSGCEGVALMKATDVFYLFYKADKGGGAESLKYFPIVRDESATLAYKNTSYYYFGPLETLFASIDIFGTPFLKALLEENERQTKPAE